ncbi:glycosyl transferase family 1 [Sporosarcina luteola]|uniref:Glycosyl transferase family 1 n=1 Tax=Sporosarcina luteola TaxID=582850 RepID=A0A511Z2Z3_9BACL|nr:glycosyltransferase family 4 protein [Sporosarcina luteola]GEN81819.1 glycosyl transferase family 1 [Sporosarcina luteola]
MTNKKILQVCAIDVSVDALLKPLILKSMEEGYEVHNACTDTGKFTDLKRQGLHMVEVSIDRQIHPIKNLGSVWNLYKLMKREKYDVVHVHTPIAALLGRIAAKLAGVKNVIYTAHGFYFHEEMSKKQYNLFFNIEKFAAKWMTDWLLLQSKEDYELALIHKFKPQKRIVHLGNGVDIWNKFHERRITHEEIHDFRMENNLDDEDFVFSFIGRLVKEKGIFELVEAFKSLSDRFPQAKLLLIGGLLESERDHESYDQLLRDLNHPKICYLGFRNDIPRIMKATDTFILPSYREGLPRSIIEAMAMSKPIIATNIRGCREEVFPGKNGFLVEKANAEELEEAMVALLENPELVCQFGNRSREITEELFDEEKVLSKQIELFNMLTDH